MEKSNEIIELKITDTSDPGQGIGRIDGMVVFVEGGLPGDFVSVKITEKRKKFLKGRVIEIKKPSENRVDPKCSYSDECGGCAFMRLDYKEQLEIKQRHLKDKLERIGGIIDYECEPIISMKDPCHYRNKTEFSVSSDGKIGLIKQSTNDVVDITECFISSPVANTILSFLRQYKFPTCINIKKFTVRTSFLTGETMVIFNTESTDIDTMTPLITNMNDAVNQMKVPGDIAQPGLESVYLFNESKKKNPYTLVAGKRTINDGAVGLNFEISPSSFYQTNPVQTEKLLEKIVEYVDGTGQENIFDLYCGVGSMGLVLADSAKKILGIEINKDAVLDANRNAVINGIINAIYLTGKAEELMDELDIKKDSVILLDPPRAGCRPEVIEAIIKSKAEKIIYVSCDPGTFARDVKVLARHGFALKKITPVDMFPQTVHLETVALMSRL